MAETAPYDTDLWNDLPHYTCLLCGDDSMLLDRMTAHSATCPLLAVVGPVDIPAAPDVTPATPAPELPAAVPPDPLPNGSLHDDEEEEVPHG